MRKGNHWIVMIGSLSLLAAGCGEGGSPAATVPEVSALAIGQTQDLFSEGDHSEKEILRYRRIRVDRRPVIVGESGPRLVSLGEKLLLVGRSGKTALSHDGGASWEEGAPVPVSGAEVRALTALADGTVLAALVHPQGGAQILSSDGRSGWRTAARIDGIAGSAQGGLAALKDGAVLLSLGGQVHRSSDRGLTWTEAARLPASWSALHPLQISSGQLVAALLYEGEAGQQIHRNTFLTRSSDGATWSEPVGVTRKGQIPGNLVQLPDGRLVLSYGEEADPYGARAILSSDGGAGWGTETFILGANRYGPKAKPRPVMCEPSSGVATAVLPDGTLVSAFDRGASRSATDEEGSRPAIHVVRWKPEGFEQPPLAYPELWTYKTDARGYLDNGMVRMRPDDRFEGGDYVEESEMTVYRRLSAEQRAFPEIGAKGVVISRHPDGSLIFASRELAVYRSRDEGVSWKKVADIELIDPQGATLATWGFGVSRKGTFLYAYGKLLPEGKGFVARSDDEGRTWTQVPLDPAPMQFMGHGDSSRIVELADGTLIMSCGNTWSGEAETLSHWATARGYAGDLILRSRDDGRTWGDPTVLPPGSCETNFLELPSGNLLIASRYQREAVTFDLFRIIGPQPVPTSNVRENYYFKPLFPDPSEYARRPWWGQPDVDVGRGRFKNEVIMISPDGGRTFSTPEIVTRLHMVSADPVLLPDGRVALIYDHKDAPHGPRALISRDQGRSWEEEHYVIGYGFKRRGRPSSVVLKDGRIYSLYAEGSQGINATVWAPEK